MGSRDSECHSEGTDNQRGRISAGDWLERIADAAEAESASAPGPAADSAVARFSDCRSGITSVRAGQRNDGYRNPAAAAFYPRTRAQALSGYRPRLDCPVAIGAPADHGRDFDQAR